MEDQELPKGWVKQKEWWGNPSLGLDSYMKEFTIPSIGRKVPVYVFGKFPHIHYCVHAGANSEYSYSGCFYPLNPDFIEFMNLVDALDKRKQLIR